MILPFARPIHRQTGPVTQQRQHDPDARIVFIQSRLPGGGRGEQSSAQSTPQPLQLKDRCLEDGLGDQADQPGRGREAVEFGLEALGAEVAGFMVRMRHRHPPGRRVILGALASVSPGFGFGGPGEDRRQGRGQELGSLLGFRPENHPPEPGQAGRLLFQRGQDPLQGPQQRFHQLIGRRRQ